MTNYAFYPHSIPLIIQIDSLKEWLVIFVSMDDAIYNPVSTSYPNSNNSLSISLFLASCHFHPPQF
jgi:hypothetical protein